MVSWCSAVKLGFATNVARGRGAAALRVVGPGLCNEVDALHPFKSSQLLKPYRMFEVESVKYWRVLGEQATWACYPVYEPGVTERHLGSWCNEVPSF